MKICINCQNEVKDEQPICSECYHERLPKCPKCKLTFIYIKPGDKAKKEFYEGYYRCQNQCRDPNSYGGMGMYKIKDSDVFKSLKRTPKEMLNLFK